MFTPLRITLHLNAYVKYKYLPMYLVVTLIKEDSLTLPTIKCLLHRI